MSPQPVPVRAPVTACLRVFDSQAVETEITCLPGLPQSIGITTREDGTRFAAVILSATPDGAVMVDSRSAEWLDHLIAELMQARDELVYGHAILPRVLTGGSR